MTHSGSKTLPPLVLIVFLALRVGISHAQAPGSNPFNDEASKQSSIYQSRGSDVPEGYVTDRSLLSYAVILPSGFRRSLADLGEKDQWLDIGAGAGQAVVDYCNSRYDAMYPQGPESHGGKAKAVAMSIEDRRSGHWHQAAACIEAGKIRYLSGRRLREYSQDELGQFQLMTDVLGGFSYTRDLSLFMEKALGFLAVNGTFYTMLQDVWTEQGTNRPYYPNASFLTALVNADGAEVRMCAWLKRITCVEVTCEPKAGSAPPFEGYRIHKVCSGVTVPHLVPIHFEAGTPPERGFRVTTPSGASRPD